MKLYKHQELAINKAKNFNNVGFYLDMGLGKTFVGTEQMKIYNNKNNVLICQNSKVDDWAEHLKKFSDYEVFKIKSKSDIDNYLKSENDKIAVINYEKVYRDNYKHLNTIKNITLMIDESSVLGNPKTNIVKSVRKFDYKNLILLSGTPTSGKYEKLWVQLNMLGWDIQKNKFESNYLNQKLIKRFGRVFYQLDKIQPYKNVERLKRKMREYGCIFMKTEEVFALPEQNFYKIQIKQEKVYKDFLKDNIVRIGNEKIIGDTTLTKMLGERMLTSVYSKNKINVLKDLINSTEDRLIIFYNFKKELELLDSVIDRPKSYVNGDVVDKFNYENFNNSITLMQYQAGAKGHNMQLANKLIFYSPTLKCEDYMQSIKRIHRIGQEKKCFYYELVVDDSIESKIYKSLKKGEDYTNELFTGI